MNGIGRLYKNEMKKMIRQTGFKVLLIILSVLVVLLPVFVNVIEIIDNNMFSNYHWYDSILESPNISAAERAYYTASKEADDFFEKENAGDWLYGSYYCTYGELKKTAAAYDLLIAGEDINDIENFFYDLVSVVQLDNGEYAEGETIFLYDDHDYLRDLSLEEARECRDMALAYAKQIENAVHAGDFYKYIASVIAELDNEIKLMKDDIAERSASVPNLSEAPKVLAENRADSMRIEGLEELKKANQFICDNKLAADSWQYHVINSVLQNAVDSYLYPEYTEDEYAAVRDQYRYEFDNYEQYAKKSAENREYAQNAFARVNYAFEKNIPLPEGLDTSVKGMWQTLITVVCSLIIVFMIIAAGMSMSSEYSSGTIRLLLVRPRKRWKILFSKLISVLTYSVILMAAALVVPLVLTIAFNGVGDSFVPDVVAKNGVAYEVNSIISSTIVLAKCSISGFMHMSFAFMLSTVVGKSALAIALPFVARTFAGTLQTISYLIAQFWPGIKYTPLPYFDLSSFAGQQDILFGISSMIVSGFSFGIGLVYNIFFTALALVIAFTVFSRKEIKN